MCTWFITMILQCECFVLCGVDAELHFFVVVGCREEEHKRKAKAKATALQVSFNFPFHMQCLAMIAILILVFLDTCL